MKLYLHMTARAVALAMALSLLTAPTFATGKAPQWTGLHIGAHIGYGTADTDTAIGVDPTIMPAGISFDGLSATGAEVGGSLGYDVRLPNSPFVIGVFGDWSWRDLDHTTSLTLGPLSASASLSIEDAWTIGGRAGYLLNDSTLLYALVGYRQASMSSLKLSADGIGATSFGVGDLKGWTVGGGLETQLSGGWALRGEYRFTRYDGQSVELIPGALALDLDTDEHVARLGAVWRLSIFE